MYDKRKDYSKILKESAHSLRVLVSDEVTFSELADSFYWTVNSQFKNVKNICFQYEEGQLIDLKILQYVFSCKCQFKEIFINEENCLNGDYLQAHYTPIYFKMDNEWVECYAQTLKITYN